ncbi:MAG: tRNA (adenosine(37)-N6)-dimethylallyltransferase MiaA [Smithellaceae bacterium]
MHRKGYNIKTNLTKKNLIVLLGATASGKTGMAARLASETDGEIISADSRQVYRGMDLGTGKDLDQYVVNGRRIAFHLIDIIEPSSEFNVYDYKKKFHDVFKQIRTRGNLPILAGGTGLYLEAVLMDYQMPQAIFDSALREALSQKTMSELQEILNAYRPQLHNKTDLEDRERLIRRIEIEKVKHSRHVQEPVHMPVNAAVFGIRRERSVLRDRIALRLQERIDQGMIEEVASLHAGGLSWERLESFGLEYRFVARFLQNLITKDEMSKRLTIAIGQFAKRQETWFRRMEKRGIEINWVDGDDYSGLSAQVQKAMHE